MSRIACSRCGAPVSTELPVPATVIRAWIECPECIEKGETPMTVYVITWEAGREFGVVGIYGRKREAEAAFKALIDHGDLEKKFKLTTTEAEVLG